jgi:hypothetical protein
MRVNGREQCASLGDVTEGRFLSATTSGTKEMNGARTDDGVCVWLECLTQGAVHLANRENSLRKEAISEKLSWETEGFRRRQ